mmetsp:Transcript_25651/g.85634  ORF Transcript_25651/g.85634 Transcript_25651/m.85634 type:complete len:133 (+) Transcript_25651:66-464(+)
MGVRSVAHNSHTKTVKSLVKNSQKSSVKAKKVKAHEVNRARRMKKKEHLKKLMDDTSRGREGAPMDDAKTRVAVLLRAKIKKRRSSSRPIKPGHGSGTPGALSATKKLEKAVRVSKRGGRRRKPTWRSMGRR